jgi:hypothetical protein
MSLIKKSVPVLYLVRAGERGARLAYAHLEAFVAYLLQHALSLLDGHLLLNVAHESGALVRAHCLLSTVHFSFV